MNTKRLMATLLAGALCQLAAGLSQAQNANGNSTGEVKRGPREVIADRIQGGVAQQLKAGGASVDDLQVSVAINRDSATPFQVTYQGLRNFIPSDGTTPDANGKFIMEYVGGGKWQGKLGGVQFTVPVGATDNIDLPFVDDPQVIGQWESVDFVADPADFNPQQTSWKGKLYLSGLSFVEGGKTAQPWWTWTKGLVLHKGDKTASRYEVREINGAPYLFFEWKSGDVTISGMKPHYYVLRKKPATN